MNVLIDHRWQMKLPQDFSQVSEEELRENRANMTDEGMVFRSEERHIFLQIFWKKVPMFGNMIALEKVVDLTVKQHQKVVPTYRSHKELSRDIAGQKAAGFSYEYTVQDMDQVTMYYLIRYEKKYYAFSCIMRKENQDRDAAFFQDILGHVEKI